MKIFIRRRAYNIMQGGGQLVWAPVLLVPKEGQDDMFHQIFIERHSGLVQVTERKRGDLHGGLEEIDVPDNIVEAAMTCFVASENLQKLRPILADILPAKEPHQS